MLSVCTYNLNNKYNDYLGTYYYLYLYSARQTVNTMHNMYISDTHNIGIILCVGTVKLLSQLLLVLS